VAFAETVLPSTILLGSSSGPKWDVEVIEYGQGARYVNRRINQARYVFNLRHIEEREHVYTKLLDFFQGLGGPATGFLVDYWLDNSTAMGGTTSSADMVIGTGDGAATQFNLTKTYTAGSTTTSRRIFKPKTGTVKIGVASSSPVDEPTVVYDQSPETPSAGQVNVNTVTGVVTFGTAPGAGEFVTWGGEFYIPVALQGNAIDIIGPDKWYEAGITLVELLNPNA
jgi:uncharacterized protein (TIGR02217 family)